MFTYAQVPLVVIGVLGLVVTVIFLILDFFNKGFATKISAKDVFDREMTDVHVLTAPVTFTDWKSRSLYLAPLSHIALLRIHNTIKLSCVYAQNKSA